MPVYESLRHVRSCIAALARWTEPETARLIVVDDGSSIEAHRAVRELLDEQWHGEMSLLRNEANLGFLRTANRGMQAGSAPAVVLLNSDALVSPGWLEGLLTCLYSSSDVGIASPLSNHGNLTSLRAYYGADYLDIAAAVRRCSLRRYPEIRLATGFCMVVRRELVESLDYFDERYGRGYFEESDLCLRAAELGWRTVADDTTYVHHHGWGSFGVTERDELMARNRELFEERWGDDAHGRLRREVRRQHQFVELERRVAAALSSAAQVQPQRELPRKASRHAARNGPTHGRVSEATQREPTFVRLPLERWRAISAAASCVPSDGWIRDVLFLAPDLVLNPSMTHLLQVIDRLSQSGVAVSLATSGRFDPALFAEPCRLRPFVLSGPDEMIAEVPPHRIVVALGPNTVYDALLLRERDGNPVATWFDPQAGSTVLGWPDEAWAMAFAPTLTSDHFGPIAPTGHVSGRFHRVPFGVCLDTFGRFPMEQPRVGVLIPHDASAGAVATADVRRAVGCLIDLGCSVRLYGDGVSDIEVDVTPFLPQADEAQLLARAAVLLEVAPVAGLERLRLRGAASGTPMIASGPVSSASPLEGLEHLPVVPRGDVPRAAESAARMARDPSTESRRVASAHEHARRFPIDREVDALVEAIERVSAT